MGSSCWMCRYISTDMQHCGKGLKVMASRNCSGYVEVGPRGEYTIYPGCSFPVSDFTEAITKDVDGNPHLCQSYHIESYSEAFRYTADQLSWVETLLDDVGVNGWTMDINTYADGSTKVDIYNPPVEYQLPISKYHTSLERAAGKNYPLRDIKQHSSIPEPAPLWWAWWVDPTLSYEEGIPMYALLIGVNEMGRDMKSATLLRALEIGYQCKGEGLSDWAVGILNGGRAHVPKQNHRTLKSKKQQLSLSLTDRVWAEHIYPHWVVTMDTIHRWLDE